MSGVTSHNQHPCACRLQTAGHQSERWPGRFSFSSDRAIAVRHFRIGVDEDAKVILLNCNRRRLYQFVEEISGGLGTHSTHDADNEVFASSIHRIRTSV